MTGWLFEPLCCLADFLCESKLSQIKSSPHHNLSGLPVILAKTPFATLIEKQGCTLSSIIVRVIPQAVFERSVVFAARWSVIWNKSVESGAVQRELALRRHQT